jgi:hypothetical protein
VNLRCASWLGRRRTGIGIAQREAIRTRPTLTFTLATDVRYSNSGTAPASFAACTYTPSAGYDPNVRYLCLNPKGQMLAGNPDPTFSAQFRVRIK